MSPIAEALAEFLRSDEGRDFVREALAGEGAA